MAAKNPLDDCLGFEWDEENASKNWDRHHVTQSEAEEVFFCEPLVVRSDIRHSKAEERYYCLRKTAAGRSLFVAFTIRSNHIRVIPVRDMNRKEVEVYKRHEEETDS